MLGLMKPRVASPELANGSSASAMYAAHIGAAKLVPPYSFARQVVWSAQV